MGADPAWLTGLRRWLDAALLHEARRLAAGYRHTPDELHRHFVSDAQVEALLRERNPDAPTETALGLLRERAADLATGVTGGPSPLAELAGAYRLSAAETLVLATVLAPETETSYRRVFGYLNDDLARPLPTIDVLLRLVPGAEVLLDRTSALFASRLLETFPAPGAAHWRAAGLTVAEPVRAHLLSPHAGRDLVGNGVGGTPAEVPGVAPVVEAVRAGVVRAVVVRGATAGESLPAARCFARALGRELVSWHTAGSGSFSDAVTTARLEHAVLYVDVVDARACDESELRWALSQPVVVAVGARAASGTVLPDGVAHVELSVPWSPRSPGTAGRGVLSSVRRPPSVQLVEATYAWDDLVLPEASMRRLRELSAAVEHRDRVLDDWAFRRLSGGSGALRALLTGVSGTGKTMSAAVVAAELGLPLWKVDLSAVVSKYIGETEKNLEEVFAAVEGSRAILMFDEADALFGKRSEISDAHDRYANIEVAYLLQRIESFDGVLLLATNLPGNLDTAFARRIQFEIEFPMPDETARLRLWHRALPPEAPRTADIDVERLAAAFALSGGEIRTVALGAAFLAAYEDRPIAMDHLLRAVARQRRRAGKLPTLKEFGDSLSLVHGEAS
ncbi:AAA ATPase central domain protein [Xylanimonas cellulosilytica DSM 15894]|uniref:AAA ATPase central domain protein n=1 Tax=Xylanimonas cellulosilytica (strain DSM 15894 / JCM 12276 / CECT 5975 / KCTC 9989 / LMG 20990 / NBRC 107835 / XIL07) TaxID=446471 RepID=D1BTI3_XYLCX|nr:ATP-binding protein [Xylanimonas cellulosilytica]ACZ30962.1 AAA ATPase central domain protein [Xylanimonas cellulosilytica DSM 15894]